MIRMSDIIKMSDPEKPRREERVPVKEAKESQVQAAPRGAPREETSKDAFASAREIKTRRTEAVRLYDRGIVLIESAFNQVRRHEEVGCGQVLDFTKTFVETMLVEEKEQLFGFYEAASAENYLLNHSVNVSLLSIKMGVWLELDKSELIELGAASFLHDLGMIKVEDIVRKEGRLGARERRKVARHPEYGERLLRETSCLNEDALSAVKTHHLRGPRHKFSQIISLADIYEAITHPRLYKGAKTPYQAVGEIMNKELLHFQSDIMRTFINNVGIYPIGSWVRLSTGEIAIVTEVNKGYPLSPKVNVMFNHRSEPLRGVKVLDFASESYFYIDGPVDVIHKEKLEAILEEEAIR